MAGLLYFLETDSKAITAEQIQALGIGYAFTGPATSCEARSGPGGKAGLCFAEASRSGDRVPGYFADQQEWLQFPKQDGRGTLWVGYWKAAKPKPDELERASLIRGLRLTLKGGETWQVPEVRAYDDEKKLWASCLPSYIGIDPETGRMTNGKPLREYRHLWDATSRIASDLFEAEAEGRPPTVSDDEMWICAGALLGGNYVVSHVELSLLEAWSDDGDVALVVMAACRRAQLIRWLEIAQKKS